MLNLLTICIWEKLFSKFNRLYLQSYLMQDVGKWNLDIKWIYRAGNN